MAIDMLTCPHCGGLRSLIAFLTEPTVVREILTHRGHSTEFPVTAPERSAPEFEFTR